MEDKILQFMSIASIDHDVALVYLEETGYNLDAAVNRFFSQVSPSPAKPAIRPSGSVRDEEGYVKLEHVPQPKVRFIRIQDA
jgi:hypothetical protein